MDILRLVTPYAARSIERPPTSPSKTETGGPSAYWFEFSTGTEAEP